MLPALRGVVRGAAAACARARPTWAQPCASYHMWQTTNPHGEFAVRPENGLLPRSPPLVELPAEYADVEDILQQMPMVRRDGSPGLLATGQFGAYVKRHLRFHDLSQVTDPKLRTALFRDYSFLASAYLLEPSHLGMLKTGTYAEARDTLPKEIAVPLTQVTNQLEYSFPFLDYAQGYALNNWRLKDPNRPPEFDNLELIRAFHGGPDEAGFILIHVAMVACSSTQVSAAQKIIHGAIRKDTELLAEGLAQHRKFLDAMYGIFGSMWQASKPKGYLGFRTFIMGMTGNDTIFPRGVIYEGVDNKPRFYRGETGAQDSMIPIADTLFEMEYPRNKLTEYLFELRYYRPKDHRAYIQWVKESAQEAQVKYMCLQRSFTTLLLLMNLEIVQAMRNAHWSMTKAYIINNTKHPKATGGTPITSFLPNSLGSTLEYMQTCCATIDHLQRQGDKLTDAENETFMRIKDYTYERIETLRKEVLGLQSEINVEQDYEEFQKRGH